MGVSRLPPGIHFDKDKKGSNAFYFVVRFNNKIICRRGFSSAESAYLAMIAFKNKGIGKNDNMTFKEVFDNFIAQKSLSCVNETISIYKSNVKNYVTPYININKKFIKLTDSDFNLWYKSISKLNNVSLLFKNRLLTLFKLTYEYATVYLELDNKALVRIPKFKDDDLTIKIEENKKEYLSPDELSLILDNTNEFYGLLYKLSYSCGLRIGESRGLTVDSFDYDHNKIYITKQVQRSSKGGSVARRLKTSSSKRVCLISKSLSDEIKHHIEENHLKNKDYLFFSSQRKNYPLSKHAIENNLKHASDLAKIEGVHFHLFRHSAATVLYQSGFNSMSIKNFLGHSSDATTKKYYIHDDEKTPQEMADKMYEMLSKCYQK